MPKASTSATKRPLRTTSADSALSSASTRSARPNDAPPPPHGGEDEAAQTASSFEGMRSSSSWDWSHPTEVFGESDTVMQEDGRDQFSRTRSSMKVDLKLLAKQVSTNRLHTPWYMEQREGECASGCDDVAIMHCITCVSSFCTKCSEEHSKESQSHRLVPYEEKHKKKVLHLKKEGWHWRTLRELGMSDSATVNNLTKSFKDLQSARNVLSPEEGSPEMTSRQSEDSPEKAGSSGSSPYSPLRGSATDTVSQTPADRRLTAEQRASYILTGEPGSGDFANPPSRPVGPLFRRTPGKGENMQGGSPGRLDSPSLKRSKSRSSLVSNSPIGKHKDERVGHASFAAVGIANGRSSSGGKPRSKHNSPLSLSRNPSFEDLTNITSDDVSGCTTETFDWNPVGPDGQIKNFFDAIKSRESELRSVQRNDWSWLLTTKLSGGSSGALRRTSSTDTAKERKKSWHGEDSSVGTGIKLVDKLHASTAFSRTSSADSAIRRRKNWLAEDALHGTAQGLILHSRRRSSINSDNQSDGSSRDSAKSTRRNSESSCQPDRVTETDHSEKESRKTERSGETMQTAPQRTANAASAASAASAESWEPARKKTSKNAGYPKPVSPRNPWLREGRRALTTNAGFQPLQKIGLDVNRSSMYAPSYGNKSPIYSLSSVSSSIRPMTASARTPSAGLLQVQKSLDMGSVRPKIKKGLVYVEELLGMEPICCFCEVSSHHITISNEKDPEKMMYRLHLLQVSFRLCTVSSRRLVICSMRPTEQVRKANAFTGTKTQFDEGRAVLVAKSRDEIGQWHDIMRENARELLRKEDKCSRDDAEVLTFDLRPGTRGVLKDLSKSGSLGAFNGQVCVIHKILDDKIQVGVGDAEKKISVNPENVGGFIKMEPVGAEGRQKLERKLENVVKWLELKYAGREITDDLLKDEESDDSTE